MGFRTDAIHAGQEPDPATGALTVPIYQTSTYVQAGLGKHKGYEYARTENPTRIALERNMTVLEGGIAACAFASGMAAETAVTQLLLEQGDHAVCTQNLYGGTFRLFDNIVKNYGVEFSWVDTSNLNAVRRAIRPNTKMVFIETPTNPLMTIADIAAISGLARDAGCRLVVDNTFMSPYLQRPIALGADIVVHSTTKFLNGHSDSVGGVVVLKDAADGERMHFIQNAAGAILSPFDSWLVLRGIKTLPIRMEAHNSNGRTVAQYLRSKEQVKKVYYPGLSDHPQHLLAKQQMSRFRWHDRVRPRLSGGRVPPTRKRPPVLLGRKLRWGSKPSFRIPATMTHASIPKGDRDRMGITEGLVRLSVGIEDTEDLIADLENAFGD